MNLTNTKSSFEHANERTIVYGETYTVWENYKYCGTFAKNEAGEVNQIKFNGYVSKDPDVRKAIAAAFNIKSSMK